MTGMSSEQALREALDELWGAIDTKELSLLSSGTIDLARVNHVQLWHSSSTELFKPEVPLMEAEFQAIGFDGSTHLASFVDTPFPERMKSQLEDYLRRHPARRIERRYVTRWETVMTLKDFESDD